HRRRRRGGKQTVVVVKSESAPAPPPPKPAKATVSRPVPLPDTVKLSSSLHNPSAVPHHRRLGQDVRAAAGLVRQDEGVGLREAPPPRVVQRHGAAPVRVDVPVHEGEDARARQDEPAAAHHRHGDPTERPGGRREPHEDAQVPLGPRPDQRRTGRGDVSGGPVRRQDRVRGHEARDAASGRFVVDWDGVAKEVGDGASPADCQRAFLSPPSEEAKLIADVSAGGGVAGVGAGADTVSRIVDDVDPGVIRAAVDAALNASAGGGDGADVDVDAARRAGIVGAVAASAASGLREQEDEISRTLMEIAEQRIRRLENRTAVLDDVEALLEAERVSLELERRDLYTARCRHWFGDGY
ncbi:hypothetical protein THAOC_04879, partial [Thalassiosira oceanica]